MMNTSFNLYKTSLCILAPALLMACSTPTADLGADVSSYDISNHKNTTLAELGQFNFDNRESIHIAINDLSLQLFRIQQRKVIKTARTNTIENHPFLKLIDKDGDGYPDQFVYIQKDARGWDTPDYGFMYDLNGDGKFDYIVYNQGIVRAEDKQKAWKFLHTLYHWIDSNYDGIIDTWVYPDIDLNTDGVVDGRVYGWLYDASGEGIVESGEYLGSALQRAIDVANGVVDIKRLGHENIESVNKYLSHIHKLSNKVLVDINNLF